MSKKTIFKTKDTISFTEISIEFEVNGKAIHRIAKFSKPYEHPEPFSSKNLTKLNEMFYDIVINFLPEMNQHEAWNAIKKVNSHTVNHLRDFITDPPSYAPIGNIYILQAILGTATDQDDSLVLDLTGMNG